LYINIRIVRKNRNKIKNVPLAGLEMCRLEPCLALSGTTVVMLDVFGRVIGRYDDGGGGISCPVLVRKVCLTVNEH
jgi:hypothetical protein